MLLLIVTIVDIVFSLLLVVYIIHLLANIDRSLKQLVAVSKLQRLAKGEVKNMKNMKALLILASLVFFGCNDRAISQCEQDEPTLLKRDAPECEAWHMDLYQIWLECKQDVDEFVREQAQLCSTQNLQAKTTCRIVSIDDTSGWLINYCAP